MVKQFGRDPESGSDYTPGKQPEREVQMAPWMQRLMIGVMVAVLGGGIAAWSNLVIRNNETASRIEAKVDAMSIDVDNFINIRYQNDLDDVREQIAEVRNSTK